MLVGNIVCCQHVFHISVYFVYYKLVSCLCFYSYLIHAKCYYNLYK